MKTILLYHAINDQQLTIVVNRNFQITVYYIRYATVSFYTAVAIGNRMTSNSLVIFSGVAEIWKRTVGFGYPQNFSVEFTEHFDIFFKFSTTASQSSPVVKKSVEERYILEYTDLHGGRNFVDLISKLVTTRFQTVFNLVGVVLITCLIIYPTNHIPKVTSQIPKRLAIYFMNHECKYLNTYFNFFSQPLTIGKFTNL